jgi:hypothetical protein
VLVVIGYWLLVIGYWLLVIGDVGDPGISDFAVLAGIAKAELTTNR